MPAIAARVSAADGTVKYGVSLPGGGTVETVFMAQRDRVTLCVSSQVGCALNCGFCLTARMGLIRHLTAGEIVGQIALVQEDQGLRDRPFNIVFMGMGEPLHNFDAVIAAFRLLIDPAGFAIARRRITISTSGLAPAIERLAAEPVRPRLAVSLNATTDAVRERLMPVNRKYPLAAPARSVPPLRRRDGRAVHVRVRAARRRQRHRRGCLRGWRSCCGRTPRS